MACSTPDCPCFDRLVKWLEQEEAHQLEQILRLSKLQNRNRDIFRIQTSRTTISNVLMKVAEIRCDRRKEEAPQVVALPWWQSLTNQVLNFFG